METGLEDENVVLLGERGNKSEENKNTRAEVTDKIHESGG